jgi:hypothetical protein
MGIRSGACGQAMAAITKDAMMKNNGSSSVRQLIFMVPSSSRRS